MKKRKLHSLIDKVYDKRNLRGAWEKVKANQGASGVDKVTIGGFEKNLEENLEELHQQLRKGTYRSQPVRRVWIPKSPDGKEKRPLGIPAVIDRVAQQAVLNMLGPHFERMFHDRSYGFRPGRSTHMAMRAVWAELKAGVEWLVDLDIKGYFDSIPHERLIDFVAEEVSDGRVLKLIRMWLKAGVMEDGEWTESDAGTPQGGVISPLLANIYLHKFDVAMSEAGYSVVRYADDAVILCRTRKEAWRALTKAKEILEGELSLVVHPEKTRVVHVKQGFDFLGYHIREGKTPVPWRPAGSRNLYVLPRDKSLKRFKARIREVTRRTNPYTLGELIEKLNEVIRGWGNYFRKAHVRRLFWRLDTWIRLRVYAFISKRWRSLTWRKYPGQKLYGPMGLQRLFLLIPGMDAKCSK